jgi:phytoene synthase
VTAHVGDEIIRRHSKSFSFAARLLPPEAEQHAVATYAWCRRADDAIDLAEPGAQAAALATLEAELDQVYAHEPMDDPVLAVFQRAVEERGIPKAYALDLLKGMEMDVRGRRYDTMDDLLDYCYHVAGCVGLMMCHVMGVRRDEALKNAAHLGIAMQLTNICRDVSEDWGLDRLYLPDELLARHSAGALAERRGSPFPEDARGPVAAAIEELLDEAERYYRSGDEGLADLDWRSALAIRTARSVYSSIGSRIRAQRCDPLAGRAYTTTAHKLRLAFKACLAALGDAPSRAAATQGVRIPDRMYRFPDDILPL